MNVAELLPHPTLQSLRQAIENIFPLLVGELTLLYDRNGTPIPDLGASYLDFFAGGKPECTGAVVVKAVETMLDEKLKAMKLQARESSSLTVRQTLDDVLSFQGHKLQGAKADALDAAADAITALVKKHRRPRRSMKSMRTTLQAMKASFSGNFRERASSVPTEMSGVSLRM